MTSTPQLQLQEHDFHDPRWHLDSYGEHGLRWHPDGYGFLPLGDEPVKYGVAYWDKYQGYRDTPTERAINDAREGMVNQHHPEGGMVLDVGVGNASFLQRLLATGKLAAGYDINPVAEGWLRQLGQWLDPFTGQADGAGPVVTSVTLWDVLEHLEDPGPVLSVAERFVFMCTPIYDDVGHVLRSKHFRPGEHCWYWTEPGLVRWMEGYGFRLRWMGRPETFAGRCDVGSFVFERVADPTDSATD